MIEPEFRCGTAKAIQKLVKELNMPYEDWMQDWPYEVASPNEIDKYICYYRKLTDDDEKFVLMEAIIQATEDLNTDKLFEEYLSIIKHLLEDNFTIHQYTIYYWASFDNEDIDDCWKISLFMRELFGVQQEKKLRISEPQNLTYNDF